MAESPGKPPTLVELIWEHDLVFGGRSGDVRLTLERLVELVGGA